MKKQTFTIEEVLYWGLKHFGGFLTMAAARRIAKQAGSMEELKKMLRARKHLFRDRERLAPETRRYMARFLGENAWMLEVPELAKIAVRAVGEGWDEARIAAAMQGSSWYIRSNEQTRSWASATKGDRQELIRQQAELMAQQWEAIFGETVDPSRFINSGAAENIASGEFSFERWVWARRREAEDEGVGPDESAEEDTALLLSDLAHRYFVPLGESSAADWAEAIEEGRSSQADYELWLREQAAGFFPAYAQQIQNGVEPSVLFGSYLDLAAEEMDRPVDFSEDWVRDSFTGPEAMTLSGFRTMIRSRPEFRTTARADELGARAERFLLESFGAEVF